jgi:recombination protein RecT
MNEVTVSKPKALSPIEAFRKEATAMEMELARALPPHIPKDRFLRVVMTAVQTSMASNYTNLLECDRRSLWQSAMKAAQDGLLPDSREGAILKYGDKAQWLPMIAGIRKKARNSGEISTWDVHCVYKNDRFLLRLGDSPTIEHSYDLAQPRGDLIGAYSVALLKDGSKSYEVMSIDEIRAIRDRSQAWSAFKAGKIKSTPWSTDEAEMARKTVAKRHAKQLPSSADLDDLMRRDDELYNFEKDDAEAPPAKKAAKGKAFIEAFAEEKPQDDPAPTPPAAADGEAEAESGVSGVSPDEASAEPSPADAYALGRETRIKRKPRRVPPEIEAQGEGFKEAFIAGWNEADDEAE